MSLVIVTVALADFDVSALLVAVTCTAAGVGRSAGAVYAPAEVMVPTPAFPPAKPFTLQMTLVSAEFITVAWNVAGLPSSTDPLVGMMVTMMDGGGGGPPVPGLPPQPNDHTALANKTATPHLLVLGFFSMTD